MRISLPRDGPAAAWEECDIAMMVGEGRYQVAEIGPLPVVLSIRQIHIRSRILPPVLLCIRRIPGTCHSPPCIRSSKLCFRLRAQHFQHTPKRKIPTLGDHPSTKCKVSQCQARLSGERLRWQRGWWVAGVRPALWAALSQLCFVFISSLTHSGPSPLSSSVFDTFLVPGTTHHPPS